MMPSIEVTIGGRSAISVQPGPDNTGTRRAAFNDACMQMSVGIQHGVHGILTPDGNDAAATVIEVPRGQHLGAWVEIPSPRIRPTPPTQSQGRAR